MQNANDSRRKLSLIIPCYNEEGTLNNIVECCLNELTRDSRCPKLELVIVNDCSSDNSEAVALSLSEKYPGVVKYVAHKKNLGKGAALRTGFLHATGDFVGIQDADMEYTPCDYLTMLEPLLDGKADVVYGSRYLLPDTRRVLYWWHTKMNRTLTTFSNMFTNLDITDMETCYKLFRWEVIQEIAGELKENRFGFEPEVTALVARGRWRVYECAIHYNPRTFEEGKKINWKDGVRALYCIMHYGANTAPLPMQLILYFFIGSACAMLDLVTFLILRSCGMGLTASVLSAFALSAMANYLLCIAFLFRHGTGLRCVWEMAAYLVTLALMGGFDLWLTGLLVSFFVSQGISKALAAFAGFFGNFFLRRIFVFPKRNNKKEKK